MIKSPEHHDTWNSTWVYVISCWGLMQTTNPDSWVFCIPIGTCSLRVVSAMLAVTNRGDMVAAAPRLGQTSEKATSCTFKLWVILRLLSKKTLHFKYNSEHPHFQNKKKERQKHRIKYDVMKETSLFFRRKRTEEREVNYFQHFPFSSESSSSTNIWVLHLLSLRPC